MNKKELKIENDVILKLTDNELEDKIHITYCNEGTSYDADSLLNKLFYEKNRRNTQRILDTAKIPIVEMNSGDTIIFPVNIGKTTRILAEENCLKLLELLDYDFNEK